ARTGPRGGAGRGAGGPGASTARPRASSAYGTSRPCGAPRGVAFEPSASVGTVGPEARNGPPCFLGGHRSELARVAPLWPGGPPCPLEGGPPARRGCTSYSAPEPLPLRSAPHLANAQSPFAVLSDRVW